MVRIEEHPTKNVGRELKDIVYTEADARWVHHPQVDALVITARVANNNVHRLLVDDNNVVDIIYLDAYKRMGLTERKLSPATSPLYGFTGDHMVLRGT